MDRSLHEQGGVPDGASADDEFRTYFHTLRNAHNRVVLGIDVLINKPMDEGERVQRLAKLQEAARDLTELLDRAPVRRPR
ncbi:MAG: hypothetical protein AB1762_11710 [Gemmatimonadota bacterium]